MIKKVAVIGSGIMGAGIAAHLANAGIPSVLLDIVPKFADEDAKAGLKETDKKFRSKLALRAITEFIEKSKPSLIFDKKDTRLITPGNMEDDLPKIKECDWIVEAVTERLDIKQKVFENVEKNMRAGAVVSSNTSGLPLKSMAEGRSSAFKKNFIITHFFNPVRYMKLVEVVSGPDNDPKVVEGMGDFLENVLGKGVVTAKDTPNFIGNRIGIYGWLKLLKEAMADGLTVEEVDKIAGPATGRPKSAAFRTADMAGIDTIVHVAKNTYELCPADEEREIFKIPLLLEKIIENKWFGDKTGQGFYKKTKSAEGKKEILSLDLKSLEYKPQIKVRYDSLGLVKGIDDPGCRIRTMVNAPDAAGQFAWKLTRDTLVYAANRIPEIADDIVNVDNAMKWGFNWDLGPFETWDLLGVKEVTERLKKEGRAIPKLASRVLEKGSGTFYKKDNGKKLYFDAASSTYKAIPTRPNHLVIQTLKEQKRELKSNAGASIIDLGDGVLCVEFHTKMNAIDGDIGQMLNDAIDLVESGNNYQGLVLSNDGPNFSAGANLMLLWLESQQKNWSAIEGLVKGFQDVCMRMKHFKKPVVVAPFGLALGGGCEVSMACYSARMYGELYMGLVEVGAGLIPGGGGNKMLLLNIEEALKAKGAKGWAGIEDGGPFPKVQKVFETVAFAKVSMSCKEAVGYNYMKKSDRISLSRDSLLHDAKQDVLEYAKGYQAVPVREDILVPGSGGKQALLSGVKGFLAQGVISEHDALIAGKLAHVLTAGGLPTQGYVSEQYLLDIEREVFLQLCGEEKSQARMQALLMTGKPLRN
ncbi:MAG: 3-hydroxyacyl-CoA dehydrogenase/enoyl-CoA hydratase family protein [Deltaproteobacteria bacterium]|nr:3-hydroxyacyl-CoA dehydrogenase/enoyl-CoA hydratase family protein [Deltaproteobacteria bacterium]